MNIRIWIKNQDIFTCLSCVIIILYLHYLILHEPVHMLDQRQFLQQLIKNKTISNEDCN